MLKSCFLDQRRQPSYQPSAPIPSRCCAAAHACVRARARVASLCTVKLCRVVRVGRFRGVASRDDDPFNPITRALQSERRQPKSTGCVRLQYDRQRTATQATSKSHCLASRALGRVAAAGSSPALAGRRLREAVWPLSHQVGLCCNVLCGAAMRRCCVAARESST